MRKPWSLAFLLAVALVSWNAALATPDPSPDSSATDGVIANARESDPVHPDQHGGPGGHLPATSHNVQLVGKLRVHDAAEGIVADVGTLRGYAYLAQYSPGCAADGAGGAYVVDISNPASPKEVGFIPAHQGSYVGEGVHAIHVDTPAFTGDVLALNNEVCADGGLGGVSLWDITNPLHPTPLAENFGDTTDTAGDPRPVVQYHSVFAWQQGGRAFVVASDDEEQARPTSTSSRSPTPASPGSSPRPACGTGRPPRHRWPTATPSSTTTWWSRSSATPGRCCPPTRRLIPRGQWS